MCSVLVVFEKKDSTIDVVVLSIVVGRVEKSSHLIVVGKLGWSHDCSTVYDINHMDCSVCSLFNFGRKSKKTITTRRPLSRYNNHIVLLKAT